jgi:hypothetical protein
MGCLYYPLVLVKSLDLVFVIARERGELKETLKTFVVALTMGT